MKSTTTITPDAGTAYENDARPIDEADWTALSLDINNSINAVLGARTNLEANLQDWLNLYECVTPELVNPPWPDSSNVFLPIAASQLETALAYIVARTLVPRFFIVSGNTDEAQRQANMVERYVNAEFVRQRGSTTHYAEHAEWLHLGLRDGLGIMQAVWRRTKTTRKVRFRQPRISPEGVPITDPATAQPLYDVVFREIEQTDYDDIELRPLQLKDFGVIPAEAPSVEEAVGCYVVEWLYESDLAKMVAEGTLNAGEVERALQYLGNAANSDVAADRQGSDDKTAGGQIDVGPNQGAQTSRFFANRGPLKVFRIHSRQYDMDRDGLPEENIFWWCERNQRLLGWTPYDYLIAERPFFPFAPYPRPGRLEGYSLIERLAVLVGEICKQYNDRNNAVDIKMNPPRVVMAGSELYDNARTFAPGAEWEASDPKNAVSWLESPDIPVASYQQEQVTMSYVNQITGVNQPQLGAQSSGRRTATELRQQSAATGTRNDLVAMRFRIACRSLANFCHRLRLQFLESDPTVQIGTQNFTLPRDVLALDYRIDVSGATDPIDATTRLNQSLSLYELLTQNPLIAQDPQHLYAITRMVLEDAGRADISNLIGTEQELAQKVQAAQAAQAAAPPGAPPAGGPPQGAKPASPQPRPQ